MFEQAPKKHPKTLEESMEALSKNIIDGLNEEFKNEEE